MIIICVMRHSHTHTQGRNRVMAFCIEGGGQLEWRKKREADSGPPNKVATEFEYKKRSPPSQPRPSILT